MIRILPLLFLLCLAAAAGSAQAAAPAGAVTFGRCKICHTAASGGPAKVGPNLHGLFGRRAGSRAGFSYSPAMRNSGVVWNDATLTRFLRDPRGFIPGNRMGFPGIEDPQTLANLLAYLKQATQ